jgi:hypothetical protein
MKSQKERGQRMAQKETGQLPGRFPLFGTL